jgi:hypothetical protein
VDREGWQTKQKSIAYGYRGNYDVLDGMTQVADNQ